MNATEKAKDLIGVYQFKLKSIDGFTFDIAKQCAIACVDEIIEGIDGFSQGLTEDTELITMYYETVKKEINNL